MAEVEADRFDLPARGPARGSAGASAPATGGGTCGGGVRGRAQISPETEVRARLIEFDNPWDFEEVYGRLHDFARAYPFDPETEEYLIHITTGTHVGQICLFLLTESRHIPGKLLQTSPPRHKASGEPGRYTIIDLDLSKYDRLASRFETQVRDDLSFLKSGIETRNRRFNELIEQIERVAIHRTRRCC